MKEAGAKSPTKPFNSRRPTNTAGTPERAEESALPSVRWSSARFQFELRGFLLPPPLAMVAVVSLPLPTSSFALFRARVWGFAISVSLVGP